MTLTETYNFKKPERNDNYNVMEYGETLDAIDTALKKRVCVVVGRYQGTGNGGLSHPTTIPLDIKGTLLRIEISRDGYAAGQCTYNGPGSISINAKDIIADWSAPYVVYDNDYEINAKIRKEGDVIKSVSIVCQDNLADDSLKARIQMNELGVFYDYQIFYIEG